MWDVDSKKEIVRLKGHSTRGCEGIDISPDGKYAASSSQDGTVRVWRLPKPGAIIKAPLAEDEYAALAAKLGDVRNWVGAGANNWQSVPGGILGRGASNARFNERLPDDYVLTFGMKVMSGKRPRVFVACRQFEIMITPKVGDDSKLDVQPRFNSPGMKDLSSIAIPYKPDEATKVKFVFAGEVIECWLNGKPAAKATRQFRGRTQLEVSCGDPSSPGLIEFANFRISAR